MDENRKRALEQIEKWIREEEEHEEGFREEPKPTADSEQERRGRSEEDSD